GVVSDGERRELAQIATILDLPAPDFSAVSATPTRAVAAPAGQDADLRTGVDFTLAHGARIVFTGTMSRPREDWARAISEAGFVTGSVTKNCAVLVVEDPATQSG